MKKHAVALALAAHAAAACGPVVETNAPSDPEKGLALATLQGTVASSLDVAEAPDADVVMVWILAQQDAQGASPSYFVAEGAPIVGDLPTGFELALYDAPPDEALLRANDGAAGVAYGIVAAVAQGTATGRVGQDELAAFSSALLGVSSEHVVIYFDRDVADDDPLRAQLSNVDLEPTEGFHLLRTSDPAFIEETQPCYDEQMAEMQACHDDCEASCEDENGCDCAACFTAESTCPQYVPNEVPLDTPIAVLLSEAAR